MKKNLSTQGKLIIIYFFNILFYRTIYKNISTKHIENS